jgi:hypothetical protein
MLYRGQTPGRVMAVRVVEGREHAQKHQDIVNSRCVSGSPQVRLKQRLPYQMDLVSLNIEI